MIDAIPVATFQHLGDRADGTFALDEDSAHVVTVVQMIDVRLDQRLDITLVVIGFHSRDPIPRVEVSAYVLSHDPSLGYAGPVGSIVAFGGGGFSMEPDNPSVDDFVLGLTGKSDPRVCFLPTASGDADSYVVRFYEAFPPSRCRASHLALIRRTITNIPAFLTAQDVIYVGGGNTVSMLAVWRAHGVDRALRAAWEAGVVLCGLSAGSMCWFEAGITDSFGGGLVPLRDGLGLLPGSHCPHYSDPSRRPAYQQAVAHGLPAGIAADDGCALVYEGTTLTDIVASRPDSRAYRVWPDCRDGKAAREEPMPARLLR